MRVQIEFELDGTVLSVNQEEWLVQSMPSGRSGVAARTMGTAVGKMLAALGAGSDVPMVVLVAEFHEAAVRSARCAPPAQGHHCDGVGCC